MTSVLKVEPLTTSRTLNGPFDYLYDDERLGAVGVGSIVRVPFGPRRLWGVVVATAQTSDLPIERLVRPERVLGDTVPRELVELAVRLAAEYCSTRARALALVVPPGIGTGSGKGRSGTPKPSIVREFTVGAAARDFSENGGGTLGARQRAVIDELLRGPRMESDLRRLTGAATSTLRSLERQGLVESAESRVDRRPGVAAVGASVETVVLNEDQRNACDLIGAAIGSLKHASFLLHGVTGSGKTEVFLAAVDAALGRGATAIVLVPEIGLTPQTVTRFKMRFGDSVAVLHSAMSEGERYDEWCRLRSGRARICVGPRSAVFAPLGNVGVIVVDEEHDSSYKQEHDPRYDARTVALLRAEAAGAVLVAGSATPRMESYASMPRVVLPKRVDDRAMPSVDVLDMRRVRGFFHPETIRALLALKAENTKGILLVNRRGWSRFVVCRECGRIWRCSQCDVSLTLHRGESALVCHHCGYSEGVPSICPDCDSASVSLYGLGTERLESEVERIAGGTPVFRVDSDTARRRGSAAATLAGFEAAESGILIGTQMVAKGHDFPDVTLGVVLDADAGLRFPDFRSEERTFSLITQLAGRSGRGDRPGRVLVQTIDPQAEAIVLAARHDVDAFARAELDRREALSYPPFGSLIEIVASADDGDAAEHAASKLAEAVVISPGSVLGPAPLFRLRGKERRRLLVKIPPSERLKAIGQVRSAVDSVAKDRGVRGKVALSVDVDPQ